MNSRRERAATPASAHYSYQLISSCHTSVHVSRARLREGLGQLLLRLQGSLGRKERREQWQLFEVALRCYLPSGATRCEHE